MSDKNLFSGDFDEVFKRDFEPAILKTFEDMNKSGEFEVLIELDTPQEVEDFLKRNLIKFEENLNNEK